MSRLEVSGLTYRHPAARRRDQARTAGGVTDVSFSAVDASVTCLLGPSGSGKSTVLDCIAGHLSPQAGQVRVAGHDLAGVPVHRRPVTLLMQSAQLFEHLSVGENVEFGLRVRRVGLDRRRRRAEELLDLVHLPGQASRRPRELSGGEQQRVALARALATDPAVLLADEPLTGLDPPVRRDLQEMLLEVRRRLGTTLVVVTHDVAEAFALADRLVVLDGGRVQVAGGPHEVLSRPRTVAAALLLGVDNLVRGCTPVGPDAIDTPLGVLQVLPQRRLADATRAGSTWAIHPRTVRLVDEPGPDDGTGPGRTNLIRARVSAVRLLGHEVEVTMQPIPGGSGNVDGAPPLRVVVGAESGPAVGDRVWVQLPVDQLSQVSSG